MPHIRWTAPLLVLTTTLVTALATVLGLVPPAAAGDGHDSLPHVPGETPAGPGRAVPAAAISRPAVGERRPVAG